jgi:hypothetical protein
MLFGWETYMPKPELPDTGEPMKKRKSPAPATPGNENGGGRELDGLQLTCHLQNLSKIPTVCGYDLHNGRRVLWGGQS